MSCPSRVRFATVKALFWLILAEIPAKLNIWWPMPLFLDIYRYFIYRYNMEVDEEQIYIQ
jgi:hypothetical protein